jgi:VWFA-related protein
MIPSLSLLSETFSMKRYAVLLLLTLFVGASGSAQTPTPSASPTPVRPEDEVVRITTSLIQVDVTVTDSRGRMITDLKPEEMEIYENGKKQKISNFAFVSNVREIPTEKPGKIDRNAPIVPTSPIKQDQVRRTVALVVDDLTLSFESVYYVRRALRKYVDEQMQEGDLVAIIRTAAGIGALQQFTSDKRMLYAAIERVKWNPAGSGGIGAFAPLRGAVETGEEDDEPEPGERTAEGREREFDDFRINYFVAGTLGAVGYVVRGMSELPGRKSVMLFSDGFMLFNDNASGMRETSRIMGSLRGLIDQANRSSVVIYTLDPRGLQVMGLTAADNTGGMSMQQVQNAMSARSARMRDSQDGLIHLARETGGFAVINNNDLAGGIRRVLDDQSYYLVAYEPDEETFDPAKRRYNRLDVKVLRKGARVRYRSGFFGISDEQATAARSGQGDILHALISPFAKNEIAVRLNTILAVQEIAAEKKGKPNDTIPVVRSLLHIAAKDITFEDSPGGKKLAKFDVLAIGFGDNGVAVDSLSKTYTLTLNKERYDEFMERGFVYEVSFPIKKPGGYQLRIALKDNLSSKIGSASQYIEVPNIKKRRLTLSGVAIENLSYKEWQRRHAGGPEDSGESRSNPLLDTALRQFKRGSVINFGLSVLNSRTAASLSSQVRLYRDGKEIFVGDPKPLGTPDATGSVTFLSSLSLATQMDAGEYVLRIDITDSNTKGKYRTATQFVQFEVID